MKLIYLSMDEVNQALVRTWAEREGIQVVCPSQTDRAPVDPNDPVLIDTDHLPAEWLENLIARLGDTGDSAPVAAHSYEAAAEALRMRGVTVYRRLRPGILRDLSLAARSLAGAIDWQTSDEFTKVNLG